MQPYTFEKIQQKTVEQEILEQLRDAIITGRLGMGTHLPETELAEQMNVSRIPIREALRQLEKEGLVDRQPNRGCSVVSFDEQDVLEVFTMRAALENMAFEWAVPRMTAADFAALRDLIARQEAAIAARDYAALARLDMQFHEYVLLKTGHTRLLKSWYVQHAQCQMLLNKRFYALSDYTPETVISDHLALLHAMQTGNVPQAQQLTDDICARVSRECINILHKPA